MKYLPHNPHPFAAWEALPPSLPHTHLAALGHVQSVLLALDGTRVFNLLEEVRLRHGRLARAQAQEMLHRWRDGAPRLLDQTAARLLAALGRQLTPDETLALLREIRQHWLADLPQDTLQATLRRDDDLLVLARDIAGVVQRIQAEALPSDLLTWLGWPYDAGIQTLCVLMRETERYLALARLATLLRQLGILVRLRVLASPDVVVDVTADLDLPTLAAHLHFSPCFWHGQPDLMIRLQEMALQIDPEKQTWDGLMEIGLTPLERRRLESLAASTGLALGQVLQELQVQTAAARADIETTMAAATRLQGERWHGQIRSTHHIPGLRCGIDIHCGDRLPLRLGYSSSSSKKRSASIAA